MQNAHYDQSRASLLKLRVRVFLVYQTVTIPLPRQRTFPASPLTLDVPPEDFLESV